MIQNITTQSKSLLVEMYHLVTENPVLKLQQPEKTDLENLKFDVGPRIG